MKHQEQSEQQKLAARKYSAVDRLAKEAGFDDDAFAYTEFCLLPFFESIVEMCAKVAEDQARHYTGENNEARGCKDAANAIRVFSSMIGNYTEQKGIVGPITKISHE